MVDDTLPLVGATVEVNAEDVGLLTYERVKSVVGEYWQYAHDDCPAEYRYPEGPFDGALTLAWRMQEERDQLKARVAELEATLVAADACADALRGIAPEGCSAYLDAYDAALAKKASDE